MMLDGNFPADGHTQELLDAGTYHVSIQVDLPEVAAVNSKADPSCRSPIL